MPSACAALLQVTGIAVSDRHPYMFSGSLDKEVKCWDLEYNKASFCYEQTCMVYSFFCKVGIWLLALNPLLDTQ